MLLLIKKLIIKSVPFEIKIRNILYNYPDHLILLSKTFYIIIQNISYYNPKTTLYEILIIMTHTFLDYIQIIFKQTK